MTCNTSILRSFLKMQITVQDYDTQHIVLNSESPLHSQRN